jgi:hypothetical protein
MCQGSLMPTDPQLFELRALQAMLHGQHIGLILGSQSHLSICDERPPVYVSRTTLRGSLSSRRATNFVCRRWSALARVPSAILPNTWNVLLNPEHLAAGQIRITGRSEVNQASTHLLPSRTIRLRRSRRPDTSAPSLPSRNNTCQSGCLRMP